MIDGLAVRPGADQSGDREILASGREAAIQRDLLKLAAESTTQPESSPRAAPIQPQPAEPKEPAKAKVASPAPAAPAAKSTPSGSSKALPASAVDPAKAPETKSQSVLEMIEGHETEVKLGLILAAVFFVLGWLCGGAYVARRERKSRHKLRF
jgi:hypothetical protein